MSFREFLRECVEHLDAVAASHPDFWTDLREELDRAHLSRRARNHLATQTVIERTDRGVQAGPTMDRATQTDRGEWTPEVIPRSSESPEGPRDGRARSPALPPPRGAEIAGARTVTMRAPCPSTTPSASAAAARAAQSKIAPRAGRHGGQKGRHDMDARPVLKRITAQGE